MRPLTSEPGAGFQLLATNIGPPILVLYGRSCMACTEAAHCGLLKSETLRLQDGPFTSPHQLMSQSVSELLYS